MRARDLWRSALLCYDIFFERDGFVKRVCLAGRIKFRHLKRRMFSTYIVWNNKILAQSSIVQSGHLFRKPFTHEHLSAHLYSLYEGKELD